ncbi:glycosyltransferase family 2 protein [Sediminicola arcticus]|jgi:glycosyltransferase involved in cell wall biosynthesis|uniref:Glycosyltransferase family 2 protein n=1 Tax=Sediminicola arcticus TaxID=1574308 RepID=A0ABV2SQV9_9FLAO
MKISVCMATYNGERYLKEQIDSILRQLGSDDELIISDDGSKDSTINIIKSYDDRRIKLYHSIHRNLIFNFENALYHSEGDIIFLSDQDDIWNDNKVTRTLPFLKNHTLVFSNATIFSENPRESDKLLFNKKLENLGGFKNLFKNNYIGATIAFQSRLLKSTLPFPKKIPMHDMWLGLMASCVGKTYYIKEPLIYYRRHENNVSMTGQKSNFSLSEKLLLRWEILIQLILRVLKFRQHK